LLPIFATEDDMRMSKFKINVKKILAVINATYAVAKRKPEKIRLAFQAFSSQLHKLR